MAKVDLEAPERVINGRIVDNSPLLSAATVSFSPEVTPTEHGEGVREPVMMGHPVINIDPKQPRTGFETIRYRDAMSHTIVATAFDIVLNFVFWLDWYWKGNNDYRLKPWARDLDLQYTAFFTQMVEDFEGNSFEEFLRDMAQWGMGFGYGLGEDIWEFNRDLQLQLYACKTFPSYNFDPRQDDFHNLVSIWQYGIFNEYHPDQFSFASWPYRVGSNVLGVSELFALVDTLNQINKVEWSLLLMTQRNAERPSIHTSAVNVLGDDRVTQRQEAVDEALKKNASVLHFTGDYDAKTGNLRPHDTLAPFQDRTSQIISQVAAEAADNRAKRITRRFSIPDDYGLTNISFGSYKKLVQSSSLTSARVWRVQLWLRRLANTIVKKTFAYNGWRIPKDYILPSFEWSTGENEWDISQVEVFERASRAGLIDPREPELNAYFRGNMKWPLAPPSFFNESAGASAGAASGAGNGGSAESQS